MHALYTYYAALIHFTGRSGSSLQACPMLKHRSPIVALWLFSLARTPLLWNRRHYRAASFGADIRANLSNVAVPATGIPMHWLLLGPVSSTMYLLILYPLSSILASIFLALRYKKDVGKSFEEHLLWPRYLSSGSHTA